MRPLLLWILLISASAEADEIPEAPPGYENSYKARIEGVVLSPLNLRGQYVKALAQCEKKLAALPAHSQSIQVVSSWKNMCYALNGLNRSAEIPALREKTARKFPDNIPFLASLSIDALPLTGFWENHRFRRGMPDRGDTPLFSCAERDRAWLLTLLLNPRTLRIAENVRDADLKILFFRNLLRTLTAGSCGYSGSLLRTKTYPPERDGEVLRRIARISRLSEAQVFENAVPFPAIPDAPAPPRRRNLFALCRILWADPFSDAFTELENSRLPDGAFGFVPDCTEAASPETTAWALDTFQFLMRNRRIRHDGPGGAYAFLNKYMRTRYAEIRAGENAASRWTPFDATAARVLACGRPARLAPALRLYEDRNTLCVFSLLELARAFPDGMPESRVLRGMIAERLHFDPERNALYPADRLAESAAVWLLFLREKAPDSFLLRMAENVVRAAPDSLWKDRALAGMNTLTPAFPPLSAFLGGSPFLRPAPPPVIADVLPVEENKYCLRIHADSSVRFVRFLLTGSDISAPEHGFWRYGDRSAHWEKLPGAGCVLFCELPAGTTEIPFEAASGGEIGVRVETYPLH